MTRGEMADLQLLADFVRDWRREDGEWKERFDERLRSVEGFVTGALAERRMASRARFSQREKIGLAITAVGVVISAVIGVLNLLT